MFKTINECIQILEIKADCKCIGDDGPPDCDDSGKLCSVCIARQALNEVGDILQLAVEEIL